MNEATDKYGKRETYKNRQIDNQKTRQSEQSDKQINKLKDWQTEKYNNIFTETQLHTSIEEGTTSKNCKSRRH